MKRIDMVGKKFNKLKVLEEIKENNIGFVKCICDCGENFKARRDSVLGGNVKNCGCVKKQIVLKNRQKYIGKKYNRWTILEFLEDKEYESGKKERMVLVKCDCNNIKRVSLENIISSDSKSCGCLGKELKKDKRISYTNQTFFMLTVVKDVENDSHAQRQVLCRCECGNKTIVGIRHLLSGNTKSCGCYNKKKEIIHGKCRTHVYYVWLGMKNRCYKKNNKRYLNYGGRGIKICDEWLNDANTFVNWALENGCDDDLQIDRTNNDGNYEPSNCRWVKPIVNAHNKCIIQKNNTIGYRGVVKSGKKFAYRIKNLKEFFSEYGIKTAKEAAIARDIFIIKNDLPHVLNFPKLREKYKGDNNV